MKKNITLLVANFICIIFISSVLYSQNMSGKRLSEKSIEDNEELEELLKAYDSKNGENDKIPFSKMPHKFLMGVNAIEVEHNYLSSFYIAGEDGFITKCEYPSFKCETWQVSTFPIKKIASHPDGLKVALYETDLSGIHKISLWEWKTKKRLFIIRPNYLVTSLSWSANGNYLFVGNTENGIEVFDQMGHLINIYSSKPGIILLATTGKREKSIVTYGKSGKLNYTGIGERKKLAEYQTESDLEHPQILKNFTRIAGYKDGAVYVINAYKGEVIEKYNSSNAIFATNPEDEYPTWVECTNKKNKYVLHKGETTSNSFYLSGASKITACASIGSHLILGDNNGEVHLLENNNNKIIISNVFEYGEEKVKDITSSEVALFALKDNNLVAKFNIDEDSIILKKNIDSDSLLYSKNNIILWNKNQKKPIYKFSLEKKKYATFYKPKTSIVSISQSKDNLCIVESSGLISLINVESGKIVFSHTIEGTQNAVQRGDEHIIIAKNSFDVTGSPIFELNLKTKETIPIKLEGDLAFSLTKNTELENTFFCFLFNGDKPVSTNLIQFSVEIGGILNGKFERLLTYEDEDFDPFILNNKDSIITNLGKASLMYFNLYSKKGFYLERDYSLPKKATLLKDYIISLNYDGSISWYDKTTLKYIFANKKI